VLSAIDEKDSSFGIVLLFWVELLDYRLRTRATGRDETVSPPVVWSVAKI
jgi:hypothetical protein